MIWLLLSKREFSFYGKSQNFYLLVCMKKIYFKLFNKNLAIVDWRAVSSSKEAVLMIWLLLLSKRGNSIFWGWQFKAVRTDYGRPVRKSPSLHGPKSNPNPKFIGTVEAYFVCHIDPKFQVSLIYAFIGCPWSLPTSHEFPYNTCTALIEFFLPYKYLHGICIPLWFIFVVAF